MLSLPFLLGKKILRKENSEEDSGLRSSLPATYMELLPPEVRTRTHV
jgi:hypothetical protein